MTLDVTNDRIRIIGAGGVATFDSNHRHLLLTDFKTGSFNIEAVDAFNTGPRVFTRTFDFGAVHSRADVVTGFQDGGNGVTFPLDGTSFVHSASEYVRPDAYQTQVTGDYRFSTAIYYHFEIAGGRLRVVVNYRFPGGSEIPFNGAIMRFWAFCGTFDF